MPLIAIIILIICGVIGAASIIGLFYSLFIALPKNNNTYKIRIKIVNDYYNLYYYLPSYKKMNRLWYRKKYWTIDYWIDYAKLERYKS